MSKIGAEAIELCMQLLEAYGEVPLKLERGEASLVIRPNEGDGFEITLYSVGEDAMVSAERWHTHYADPKQAAFCVLWLLTPYYRIAHELKGGVLVAAWLERYEEDGWEPLDPVFFLNPESAQDWIAKPGEQFTHRYIQQAVLPPPRPYREFCPGAKLDEFELPVDFHQGSRLEIAPAPLGPSLCDLG
jgi:hypothetical protein